LSSCIFSSFGFKMDRLLKVSQCFVLRVAANFGHYLCFFLLCRITQGHISFTA
jgi:hypothetical protein